MTEPNRVVYALALIHILIEVEPGPSFGGCTDMRCYPFVCRFIRIGVWADR